MTKIICKDGIGREVNEHSKYLDTAKTKINYIWDRFEQSVKSYPCFDQQGKPVSEYQGEAELVWQTDIEGEMVTIDGMNVEDYKKDYPRDYYRQVYITSPQAEREKTDIGFSTRASMKFDRLMMSAKENHGDDSKSELLGHFHYDYEKGTETFVPVAPEREPVGVEESQFDKNRFYTKQLNDCPFCGAKAGEELFMYRAQPDHYKVVCSFCQASMKHDRADKVIGIWNHRGLIKNRG